MGPSPTLLGPSPTLVGPPWLRLLALWGRRAALRAGLGAALGGLLLWASLFLYGSFYYCFAPPGVLNRPVHFSFRTDCDPPGAQLCSFPSANVSLVGPNKERLLGRGQRYRVVLELELPESPGNRGLGMFLVTGTFYDAHGDPLGSTARHAMLHYRSPLLRALDTLALAGLFLAGLAEQKQTLEIELEEGYREDPFRPSRWLRLSLRSRRLQLYRARLRLEGQAGGVRFLLHHFPLTSALLGVSGNFLLLLLLLLGGLRWGGRRDPPVQPQGPPQETPEEEEPPPEEPEVVGPGQDVEPPLLTAAPPPPPPPPEEEEKEEEEGGGGGGGPKPNPPLPSDGQVGAPPTTPPTRPRPICSSS